MKFPIGHIQAFEKGKYPGAGWLKCDGTVVSRAAFGELAEIIEPGGGPHFKIPDLRGQGFDYLIKYREDAEQMSAKDKQVGGGHYKDMPIQPIDFITKNNLPFIEGCIVKYISRWRSKGGVQDLRKVIHYAELLIEAEEGAKVDTAPTNPEWPLRACTCRTPPEGSGEEVVFADCHCPPDKPLDAQNRAPAFASKFPPLAIGEGQDWPTEAPNGTRVLVWRPRKPGDPGTHLYGWVEVGFMWDGRLVPYAVPF